MDKTTRILTYLINLSFFLYFIVLLVERSISIALSFVNGVNIYGDFFNGSVYTLTFISIVGWLVFLIVFCRKNIKALWKFDEDLDFMYVAIASGILLTGGMVHTEYTIPAIQFVSYGILILGILFKTMLLSRASEKKAMAWISFLFLVSLSMAIPVMYRTNIELYPLFHIMEVLAVLMLVSLFTCLVIMVFRDREDLIRFYPILILILIDVPLLGLRWEEEINYFVLIFLAISIVIFFIGIIYKKVTEKK